MSKQVLVVDDEAGIRTLLSLMLRRRGFSVITAGSAAEVLSLIEHTTPDLFVLDIMLSGTNGIELCRALRAHPRTKNSTILMLSARGDPESTSQSMQAGADDYMFKPILQRALLDKVQRLIGISHEACA